MRRGDIQLATYLAGAFIFIIIMSMLAPYITKLPNPIPGGSEHIGGGSKGELKYAIVKIYPAVYPLSAKDDLWLGDNPEAKAVDTIDLTQYVSGQVTNFTIDKLYVKVESSYEGIFCSGGGFSIVVTANYEFIYSNSIELPYRSYKFAREIQISKAFSGTTLRIEVCISVWARGLSGYSYATLQELYLIVTIYYTEG